MYCQTLFSFLFLIAAEKLNLLNKETHDPIRLPSFSDFSEIHASIYLFIQCPTVYVMQSQGDNSIIIFILFIFFKA